MRRLLRLVARTAGRSTSSGLLAMAIAAYAVLIYVATRPSAPRPIPRYYETAERWDVDEAAAEASRQLGWSVHYEIPKGVPHVAGTPRPVDVRVADREGKGIPGLAGRLFVARPSDQRLSQSAPLVGLPAGARPLPRPRGRRPAGCVGVPDRREAGGAAVRPRRPRRRGARPGGGGGPVSRPAPAATPRAATGCAHCGLGVPSSRRRDEGPEFCCGGCEQVYGLIQEWGYGQFYRFAGQHGAPLEPARVSGRDFGELDDPRLLAELTDPMAQGRCRTRLYLEGVHCAACVWLVEKLPEAVPGVDSVRLNLGSAVAEVVWDPARVALSRIGQALDRLGYAPHLHRAGRLQEARRREDRSALVKLGVAVACAMNLMFLHGALYAGEHSGMASPFETYFRWVSLGVSLPVVLFSARPFFQAAVAGLRSRVVHMDLPVALALAVAFAASAWNTLRGSGPLWFDSLAMLVAALLGARQLQRSAQRAALERADCLRGVAFVEFARRLTGESLDSPAVEVDVHRLSPGDRVEVRSGELVPVDGVVLAGRSSLDNAVLTGESVPCPVAEGDAVSAGATNLGARIVVRVEAAGEKTRVGTLFAIVEEALARRPKVLERSDRLARWFVWGVLALSALTGLVWAPHGTAVALERVVALLVVACPCGIALSVPLALSVALTRAARAGIYVKNPDALQKLRRVSHVLLDKTGTLTEGRAALARWEGSEASLDLARALEEESAHAVAAAFGAVPAAAGVRAVRVGARRPRGGGPGHRRRRRRPGRARGQPLPRPVRRGRAARRSRGARDLAPRRGAEPRVRGRRRACGGRRRSRRRRAEGRPRHGRRAAREGPPRPRPLRRPPGRGGARGVAARHPRGGRPGRPDAGGQARLRGRAHRAEGPDRLGRHGGRRCQRRRRPRPRRRGRRRPRRHRRLDRRRRRRPDPRGHGAGARPARGRALGLPRHREEPRPLARLQRGGRRPGRARPRFPAARRRPDAGLLAHRHAVLGLLPHVSSATGGERRRIHSAAASGEPEEGGAAPLRREAQRWS